MSMVSKALVVPSCPPVGFHLLMYSTGSRWSSSCGCGDRGGAVAIGTSVQIWRLWGVDSATGALGSMFSFTSRVCCMRGALRKMVGEGTTGDMLWHHVHSHVTSSNGIGGSYCLFCILLPLLLLLVGFGRLNIAITLKVVADMLSRP